jgi:hypothetical protein
VVRGESAEEPAHETLDTTGLCWEIVHGTPRPPVTVVNPFVKPLAERDGVLGVRHGVRPRQLGSVTSRLQGCGVKLTYCRVCGGRLPRSSTDRCPGCGTQIDPGVPAVLPEIGSRFCVSCGFSYELAAFATDNGCFTFQQTCSWCGTSRSPRRRAGHRLCPDCGIRQVAHGARFCDRCGGRSFGI